MNGIDALLILIILLGAWAGVRQGVLLSLLSVARLVGSVLLAFALYRPLTKRLDALGVTLDAWTAPLAFMAILVVTGVLIGSLGLLLLRRVPRGVHTSRVNHALGLLPGAAQGLLSAVIVAALLMTLPLPRGLRDLVRTSESANRLAGYAERAELALRPVFGEAAERSLNMLTVKPESNERVTLPFEVANAPAAPDLERQMLALVNRERRAAGLAALAFDEELTAVARRHSADMFARGYFAHVSPEGETPFDRIRAAGVTYLTAGENLALAPTLAMAHEGLMRSPGHRANILRARFGRAGIGILDGGPRGLMVTQLFRN